MKHYQESRDMIWLSSFYSWHKALERKTIMNNRGNRIALHSTTNQTKLSSKFEAFGAGKWGRWLISVNIVKTREQVPSPTSPSIWGRIRTKRMWEKSPPILNSQFPNLHNKQGYQTAARSLEHNIIKNMKKDWHQRFPNRLTLFRLSKSDQIPKLLKISIPQTVTMSNIAFPKSYSKANELIIHQALITTKANNDNLVKSCTDF